MRDEADNQFTDDYDDDAEVMAATRLAGLMGGNDPKSWANIFAERDLLAKIGVAKGTLKMADGGMREFEYNNFKDVYKDEYTGGVLPAPYIHDAIIDELDYFNKNAPS